MLMVRASSRGKPAPTQTKGLDSNCVGAGLPRDAAEPAATIYDIPSAPMAKRRVSAKPRYTPV